MKQLFLVLLFVSGVFASVIKTPILSVDDNETLTIQIDKIDVGMSGFAYKMLDKNHGSIVASVVVSSFDADTKKAVLKSSDYKLLENDALPKGKWKPEVGDSVILAFGYTRALLIAPSEEIYHRITKSTQDLQWIHPDIFATTLSYSGHPTPLRSDFQDICDTTSVGILFIYLNQNLFTLDCKSFGILNITKAPLEQKTVTLPFYTRLQEIEANWWGEGSDRLTEYEPHYYKLLVEANKKNEKLYQIVKNSDENISDLIDNFEIGDKK